MNAVFWLLVILAALLLWLAVSFIFIPLGRVFSKKVKGLSDIVNYKETEQKENESDG